MAGTADRLLPTDCVLSWCDGLTKSGPLTSLAYSPLKAGYIWSLFWISLAGRVIGWAMSQLLDTSLVSAALRMAISQSHYSQNLVVHSDRGAQFASAAYRQLLGQHGLSASMSRKGNCYDNAFAESCFGTLKRELEMTEYVNYETARREIDEYIRYYNNDRRHSSVAYHSPSTFEHLSSQRT